MRTRIIVLTVLFLLPLGGAPAFAKKAPYPPKALEDNSALIVKGKVMSYTTEDKLFGAGGKTKVITLKVEVESVAKGESHARPGGTIAVTCWRGIKRPADADPFDDYSGNHIIPGTGAQATFYLEQGPAKEWRALWPNGIAAAEGTPALTFAMEPADPVADPQQALPWRAEWAILGGVVFLGLAIAGGLWLSRRRSRPSAMPPG